MTGKYFFKPKRDLFLGISTNMERFTYAHMLLRYIYDTYPLSVWFLLDWNYFLSKSNMSNSQTCLVQMFNINTLPATLLTFTSYVWFPSCFRWVSVTVRFTLEDGEAGASVPGRAWDIITGWPRPRASYRAISTAQLLPMPAHDSLF